MLAEENPPGGGRRSHGEGAGGRHAPAPGVVELGGRDLVVLPTPPGKIFFDEFEKFLKNSVWISQSALVNVELVGRVARLLVDAVRPVDAGGEAVWIS